MSTINTVSSHCSECGAQVEGDNVCAEHPNADIATIATPADAAVNRLERLLDGAEVIETDSYVYDGGTILVSTVVGNPDSEDEDYYSDDVHVAWDAKLDRPGEVGACVVSAAELATWLSLRWPCTIGGAGFARDGQWYADGRDAAR
jgi:hypothetical protein